jgi:hypothetical protein
MARLVVLKFEDDEEADRFVRSSIMMDTCDDAEYEGGPIPVFATVMGEAVPELFHEFNRLYKVVPIGSTSGS